MNEHIAPFIPELPYGPVIPWEPIFLFDTGDLGLVGANAFRVLVHGGVPLCGKSGQEQDQQRAACSVSAS